MKIIKKIAVIMLSVMMVLGMCSVVGAAGTGTASGTGTSGITGSITIENAIVGQKYKIYQILELESYDPDEDLYSYKPVLEWKDFFDATIDSNTGKAKGAGSEYITVDDNGYARWKGEKTDERQREFAKLALKYAIDNNISKKAEETAKASGKEVTTKLTFGSLPLGYYLVDSSAGALCSLDTTNLDATIQEKNGVPSVEKKVQEDSTSKWEASNTADIGQKVNFQTTITAQAGAQNYVLHDKMDAGLEFDKNSIEIKLMKNGESTESSVQATNYTVKISDLESTNPCTFHIEFKQVFCDTLQADDKIIVTYSATLNENAKIGETGNTNEAKLEYGDKNTISSTTTTKTYKIPVFKYTKKNGIDKGLPGAIFTLSKSENGGNPIKLVATETANTYRVAKETETAGITKITEVTTPDDGRFTIQGLDADTYYLTETKQPDGYNKLSAPVKIVIKEDGKITIGESTDTVDEVKVENKSGSLLPSTGGMGTTLFYIFGAILVIGSGVVLITKKRMK